MDKAPAYGAGDSGFESQYGLKLFFPPLVIVFLLSNPVLFFLRHILERRWGLLHPSVFRKKEQKEGVMRESNSRPPAPEAGIIPLDQSPFRGHSPKEGTCWS
jgi:hypothetical protein